MPGVRSDDGADEAFVRNVLESETLYVNVLDTIESVSVRWMPHMLKLASNSEPELMALMPYVAAFFEALHTLTKLTHCFYKQLQQTQHPSEVAFLFL